LGFYSKDQKTFGGATPGTPSLATSSNRKQDQGNGQGHRSPESASVLLWVTAERHMEIDATFVLVLQWACFAICSRTLHFLKQNLSF